MDRRAFADSKYGLNTAAAISVDDTTVRRCLYGVSIIRGELILDPLGSASSHVNCSVSAFREQFILVHDIFAS